MFSIWIALLDCWRCFGGLEKWDGDRDREIDAALCFSTQTYLPYLSYVTVAMIAQLAHQSASQAI